MSELPARRDPDDSLPAADATDGAPEPPEAYAAVVVPSDDEPDECTVFPVEASDEELVTTWISAAEGSFVSLDEMR
jgi:hypothetical protein